MKSFAIFLTLGLLPTLGHGSDQKSHGKSHVQIVKTSVEVLVDSGFHFNIKAPMSLTVANKKISAKVAQEKKLRFEWSEKDSGPAQLSYYVCDDANTVCENHEEQITLSGSLPQGLFLKDLGPALEMAKKNNQLVFVEFGATWCPPCIRLEHETFPSKIFKTAAKDFVLVHIDIDRHENFQWTRKYAIKAYPTIVIVDGDGEERSRIIDFLPATAMAEALTAITKNRPPPIQRLQANAKAGDKASALLLADYYRTALQFDSAVEWYQKAESKSEDFFDAQVTLAALNLAKDEKNKELTDITIKIYENAINAFPQSFNSIFWRKDLAALLDKEKGAKAYLEAQNLIDAWVSDPKKVEAAYRSHKLLELQGLVIPELWGASAEIQEELGNTEKSKTAWEHAINETMKLKPSVASPAPIIYLVSYMKKVRPAEEITPWFEKLEKAYPEEFTYWHRHANMLYEKKMYAEALPLAEKGFSLSYESNRLKSGLLLAKIQNSLNKKDQANLTMNELLASSVAKEEENKRLVKNIEDYKKETQK